MNQLVPIRRRHHAVFLKQRRVVEHADPVQGQRHRVLVHIIGRCRIDDRLRELRIHIVRFPDIVNRHQEAIIDDKLNASAGPIAEGIRRVAASQLHQDRSLELLVVYWAGGVHQPRIGGDKVIDDAVNEFATEAAEVMGYGKVSH